MTTATAATASRVDQLIPGDPAAVAAFAARIRELSSRGVRPLASSLDQASTESADWQGDGGQAARVRITAARQFLDGQATALDHLADAVQLYAEALRVAQERAATAVRLQAAAEAAWPYPAAWYYHARAELLLAYARSSLDISADRLADAFLASIDSLPPEGGGQGFWEWLLEIAPGALKILGDVLLIAVGALLMALGTGLDLTGIGAFAGVPMQAGGASLALAGAAAVTATGAVVGVAGAAELARDATTMASQSHGDSTGGGGERRFKQPRSGSGKERASDAPSWVRSDPEGRPYQGESGNDFAKRMMNKKYGEGNWSDRGPGSEFNQIKKYGDRGFQ